MKLTVVIRSIGERTEQLCYESIVQCIEKDDIFFVRNEFPAYNAYLKTFDIFLSKQSDWCLALDADVILQQDWIIKFQHCIMNNDTSKKFAVHFKVLDKNTQGLLYRGVHFYNHVFIGLAKLFIECNKTIYNSEQLRAAVNNHRLYTKLESSLDIYFHTLGIERIFSEEIIGWHGFEQYCNEIFRQYAVRALRDPEFIHTHTDIHNKKKAGMALDGEELAAYLGDEYFEMIQDKKSLPEMQQAIARKLSEFGVKEKQPLLLSLHDFYADHKIDA